MLRDGLNFGNLECRLLSHSSNSRGQVRNWKFYWLEAGSSLSASILCIWQITYELEVDVAWTGLDKYDGKHGIKNRRAVLWLENEYGSRAGDVDKAAIEADEAVAQLWPIADKSVRVLGYISLRLIPGKAKFVASDLVIEVGSVGDPDLFLVSNVLLL